ISLADGSGRMAASRTSPIPEPPVSACSSRIESDFVRLLHSLPMCEMAGGQHRHDDAPCYRRPRVCRRVRPRAGSLQHAEADYGWSADAEPPRSTGRVVAAAGGGGAGITGQPNGVHSLFLTPSFRLPQLGVSCDDDEPTL